MPFFSKLKGKGSTPSKSKTADQSNGQPTGPVRRAYDTTWNSKEVVLEEVEELVHACTAEMKSRVEALDTPFLLLPFRPDTDASGVRTFIGNYFKSNMNSSSQYKGDNLKQELRLTDPIVLCSIMKWCWSRMPMGVVTWPVYEGFEIGEKECKMARNAFPTFVPIAAESTARKNIIFDFFDLLAAVAAHGKMNGLGGRKLSRLAGWWAFEHSDDGKGFEGGYKSWSTAADASSHLFFGYLRSLSREADPTMSVIERIPRSLQALLAQTEYPPETPTLLQRSTPRVVMLVDAVSPTPFALLRRAAHFEYRNQDRILREYQEFEDPIDALTEECKRVLYAVASTNASGGPRPRTSSHISKPPESWSDFQNLGFGEIASPALPQSANRAQTANLKTIRSSQHSRNADHGRPTTPSWADFLSSGFADDENSKAPGLLLPPDKMLPHIGSRSQTPANTRLEGEDDLAPGELAAITNVELDDAFWWVWMTSLAGEEPNKRKAVFGRCALIETSIQNGAWLIMEEQVKGASPDPVEGAVLVEKKSRFGRFTSKGRLGRKKSAPEKPAPPPVGELERAVSATPSKASIKPEQQAKIKAAARALANKQSGKEDDSSARRGRVEEGTSTKTNSVLTTGLQSEAGPAMKWTSAYDKHAIRAMYLGDNLAGRGASREDLVRNASSQNLGAENASTASLRSPTLQPEAQSLSRNASNRDLPNLPVQSAEVVKENKPLTALTALPTEPDFATPPVTTPMGEPTTALPPMPSSLDKELGVSPPSPKIGRKPVPEPHPALRQQSMDEQRAISPPEKQTSPAVLAAQAAARAALEGNGETEQQNTQGKPRKQPSGAALKKLFSRNKKDASNRDSVDWARPTSNGVEKPQYDISRRLSLMRRQKGYGLSSPKASTIDVRQEAEPEPEPELPVRPPSSEYTKTSSNPYMDNLSRVDSQERSEPAPTFSRFDQGPMPDMPAAMPRDSTDDADDDDDTGTQHARLSDTRPAITPHESFATPMERGNPINDSESEASFEIQPQQTTAYQPERDRWAQIRENALKRHARQSEEQSMQSRPTESVRTDDGETSGEETIESRVARIKARVAELTGNMNGVPVRSAT